MRFKLTLKTICSLLGIGMLAAQVHAANLVETYRLAVKNDATLTGARYSTDAQSLNYKIERSSLFPSITFRPNYSGERNLQSTTKDGLVAELIVDQPVWSPALRDRIQLKQGETILYQLQLNQVEVDLIDRVVIAYFNVLAAKDNAQTAQTEVVAIEEFLSQALSRLEVGLGTLADVRNAQARFSLASAVLVQAESAIESAWLSLAELIGERPITLAHLVENMQISPPNPDNLDWWVESALNQNLSLLMQRKATELAHLGIALSTAASQPRLTFSVTFKELVSGDRQLQNRTSAFLNFTKQFSTGGQERYRKKQARLLHQVEEQKLNALTQQVRTQVSNAYLNAISSVNLVHALESALEASQSALEASQEGYQVGTLASLDVLNAQSDLFQVRRDLQKAKYDYLKNSIRLEQIAGVLDSTDIERINTYLQ